MQHSPFNVTMHLFLSNKPMRFFFMDFYLRVLLEQFEYTSTSQKMLLFDF